MNKMVALFLKTIQYYEAKTILNSFKNNKIIILFLNIFVIFIILNIILTAPLFYLFDAVITLTISIIFSFIILILFFIFYQVRLRSIEKLDYTIINNSIHKTDFFNYLKNDVYFNLKFSILISLIIFLFQILFYAILLFTPIKLSISQFIIILSIYFIIYILTFSISLLIFYFKNRNKKSMFVQIKTSNKYFKILISIILSILFFLVFFLILSFIIKNLFLIILISIIPTIIINLIISKNSIYTKSFWILLFNNIKLKIMKFKSPFNKNLFFKTIKSIEVIHPFISGLIFFIIFIFINNLIKTQNLKILIFQSVLFGCFFTYKLIIKINNKAITSDIKKPFTLTVFIYSIVLIISFISLIKINLSFKQNSYVLFSFSEFILPYINSFNLFCLNINKFLNSLNILLIFIIPILFFITYYINKKANMLFHYISNIIDLNLRKKLTKKNPMIIFGDSISLYPFLFSLISTLFILLFLYIGILPISKLFFYIFDTFKISEVFKFDFLTQNNITSFLNIIFNSFFIFIMLKFIIYFLTSILSHLILFSDEIIYYENKIYKNTILRIPLTRINYILIKQNILEKIFDYGTLYIETIDKSGVIKIKGIPSIKEKNILIMDKIKGDL